MKFELYFSVKIDSQGILASFTHWVLQIRTVRTGLTMASISLILLKSCSFVTYYRGNPGFVLWEFLNGSKKLDIFCCNGNNHLVNQ